jgi:hypothetical protein
MTRNTGNSEKPRVGVKRLLQLRMVLRQALGVDWQRRMRGRLGERVGSANVSFSG